MTDPTTASRPDTTQDLASIAAQLRSGSLKTQLQSIEQLAGAGEAGENLLMEFLLERRDASSPNPADGKIYQTLLNANSAKAAEFLQTHFSTGVVPLKSERNLDYISLQRLLAQQDFQAADRLTLEKLCELAGPEALQRKWLYFTEVEKFPTTDLQTIDRLWLVHSEGKFGFTVQRELWLALGKNWEKLWPKIGWKMNNQWTRYPQAFTWNLTAPKGHLPLSNQLRGVRVMASLLAHPAWDEQKVES